MILLLGGTSESRILATKLKELSLDVILSTATEYGEILAANRFDGKIIHGAMDEQSMRAFCHINQIKVIVDATHPFAQIVSKTAMDVSHSLDLEYLRFERPSSHVIEEVNDNSVHIFNNFIEACSWLNTTKGNILVTTGSKDVGIIVDSIHQKERLFVRFLPVSEQILKMEKLGLKPNQLIAMQGPFSLEMNKAMIRAVNATALLTKESGPQGYVDEKILAAKECGIEVGIIKRSQIKYPNLFSDIDLLVRYMQSSCL